MAPVPADHRLAELRTDLQVERTKLAVLVESLCTGIERCFVQIVRVLNGGPPDGADWHRRCWMQQPRRAWRN
jgi:hypothetical protein